MRTARTIALIGLLALATALIGCTDSGGTSGKAQEAAQQNAEAFRTAMEAKNTSAEIVDVSLAAQRDSATLQLTIRTESYGTQAFVPALASFTEEVGAVLTETAVAADIVRIKVISEKKPGTLVQIRRNDLQEFLGGNLPLDQYFLRWEYPTDGA